MRRITRPRLIICISAAIIIAALLAFSLLITDADPQTFVPVSPSTELTIDAANTSVFISVDARQDLLIERHPSRNLRIEENGDEVIVTTKGNGILQISLPSWLRIYDIEVKTTSGDVAMERLMSENLSLITDTGSMLVTEVSSDSIKAESNRGNMIFTDTTSDTTTLFSENGYIRAIGILGDINAESTSGNVYIVPIGEGNLTAETDSGDIDIIAGERSLKWNSDSGPVRIYGDIMPTSGGEEGAQVSAYSSRGKITISK